LYIKNKFTYLWGLRRSFLYQFHLPFKNKQMKNVSLILTAFVFAGLVACGPSAAEKEKKQREQDSLTQDSLIKIASEAATPPPVTDSAATAPANK
jgi:hypothetical protein